MIKLSKSLAVAALAACLVVPTVVYAQDAGASQPNGSMMGKGMMGGAMGGMTAKGEMSGTMDQNGMMNMMAQMSRMMEMVMQMNAMAQMNNMVEGCNKMMQASMRPKEDSSRPSGQMPNYAPAAPGKDG